MLTAGSTASTFRETCTWTPSTSPPGRASRSRAARRRGRCGSQPDELRRSAAVRLALPQADPAHYLTTSPGITFPFDLVLGIPLYLALARTLR